MDEQPSPLQEIREKLALALGENAVFDGWTQAAVDAAERERAGLVEAAEARVLLPDVEEVKFEYFGAENDFTIRNQQDILATQQQATEVFTSLLASIAALGLTPQVQATTTAVRYPGANSSATVLQLEA